MVGLMTRPQLLEKYGGQNGGDIDCLVEGMLVSEGVIEREGDLKGEGGGAA